MNRFSDHQPAPVPDLRIIPIEAVLPHEEHDHQRAIPLMQRIEDDGAWLNPPVVAPMQDDLFGTPQQRYTVLDGANRSYCLREMGYPHILVQVVDYHSKQVALETWNHVLSDAEVDDFLPQVYRIGGLHVEATDGDTAAAALDLRTAIAYFHLLPSRFLMLIADRNDLHTRTHKLREVVNCYKQVTRLNRINQDDPEVIRRLYPTAIAIMIFPHYTPEEIEDAARNKVFLPPGLSRHIIQGRAMRLHYPLEALKDPVKSLAEKNADLLAWTQARAANKRIRLYEEATYVFDE